MFGTSQGFSQMTGSNQETPVKRTRQEEKQTCLPVTVRLLHDAVAARTDESAEVLLHGAEAGIVHLVGAVESVVKQAAMLEFQLNDASGRIKVRHYTSGAGLGQGIEGLTSGGYVSVVGNLRTTPAVHVSAMSLRAVSSADEVSYHSIEVAHAALQLRKSTAVSGSGMGGLALTAGTTPTKQVEKENTISPMKVDAPMQAAAPVAMAPVASGDVRDSVLTVLRQEQEKGSAEGLALPGILAKLANSKVSAGKVKEIIDGLVNEGEVFTTIDDDHFSVL